MSYTIGDPCPVCGWPLMASAEEGCVPGNCAMRPRPRPAAITGEMMITIAERSKNIRHAIVEMVTARGQSARSTAHMADVLIKAAITEAVNAALEEAAVEVEKLERRQMRDGQAAMLVREMKVKG